MTIMKNNFHQKWFNAAIVLTSTSTSAKPESPNLFNSELKPQYSLTFESVHEILRCDIKMIFISTDRPARVVMFDIQEKLYSGTLRR